MTLFIRLILTLCIGAAGGILAKKAKVIPAGFMLGSLFLIIVYNLTTGYAYYPSQLRIMTQIIAGTYLGMKIHKEDILSLKTMIKPIIMIMSLYLINTILFGYILYVTCDVDLLTAFYCFAPGGISDIGIIADGMGCDVGMITFMQLIRLITVFIYYPLLFRFFENKGFITSSRGEMKADRINSKKPGKNLERKDQVRGLFVTMLITSVSGLIGYYLGVPGGAMVFAMVMGVVVNIFYKYANMPIVLRYGAQIMSGIYLGLKVTWDSIQLIFSTPIPAIMVAVSVMILPLINGYIIYKATKSELSTTLFSCTPGGMTEMTLLAEDMGLDFVKISVTHLARMITVITLFPFLFQWLAGIMA